MSAKNTKIKDNTVTFYLKMATAQKDGICTVMRGLDSPGG